MYGNFAFLGTKNETLYTQNITYVQFLEKFIAGFTQIIFAKIELYVARQIL